MTVGMLEEVRTRRGIDDIVLSNDTELRDISNDNTYKDSRIKLTFLGNRPSIKKAKDPTLYFLLEDTTSPINITKQRYPAMYFYISPRSISRRYWINAFIKNEDTRIFVGNKLRRTVPFEARERFYWALYHQSLVERIYDLTKLQIYREPNHHEEISKLYRQLREDFDYAMDSTKRIWRPGCLPLRMLSGREKVIGLAASAEICAFSFVAGGIAAFTVSLSLNMNEPSLFRLGIYAAAVGGVLATIRMNIAIYKGYKSSE